MFLVLLSRAINDRNWLLSQQIVIFSDREMFIRYAVIGIQHVKNFIHWINLYKVGQCFRIKRKTLNILDFHFCFSVPPLHGWYTADTAWNSKQSINYYCALIWNLKDTNHFFYACWTHCNRNYLHFFSWPPSECVLRSLYILQDARWTMIDERQLIAIGHLGDSGVLRIFPL